MKDKAFHLTEGQILLGLVEENDLSERARGHLETCAVCREKRLSLVTELQYLGEMAHEFTPASRNITLPVKQPKPKRFRFPVLGTGFATAVLLTLLVGIHLFWSPSRQMQVEKVPEGDAQTVFFEEILVESALSEKLLDLTPSSYGFLDDEFMEFIVPLEEQSGSSQGFLYLTAKA